MIDVCALGKASGVPTMGLQAIRGFAGSGTAVGSLVVPDLQRTIDRRPGIGRDSGFELSLLGDGRCNSWKGFNHCVTGDGRIRGRSDKTVLLFVNDERERVSIVISRQTLERYRGSDESQRDFQIHRLGAYIRLVLDENVTSAFIGPDHLAPAV